jgi:hypothetical protein
MNRRKSFLVRLGVLALGIGSATAIGAHPAWAACATSRPGFPYANPSWQFSPSKVTKALGTCKDFNIGNPDSGSDYFRGYYYSSGAWHVGAAGWVQVFTTLKPLVTNVVTNTQLKAEAYFGNEYATEAY